MRFSLILVTGSLLALGSLAAKAATITFSGTGSTITTYSEAGYNVTATSGNWHGGGGYGNPSPSAYVDPPGGTLSFTRAGGGLFTFSSVDLSTAQAGTTVTYDFRGLLGGTQIFDQSGTDTSNSFLTFLSAYSTSGIDTLRISLASTTSTDFNMDNVVLQNAAAVTPEPSSLVLLGTGVLAAAGAMRRRFRTA